MALDPKSTVNIGRIFQVRNRKLERTWKGDLDSVCRQISADGHVIPEIWNSVDSEVTLFPLTATISTVGGKEIRGQWSEIISMLHSAKDHRGEKDQPAQFMKSLSPAQFAAVSCISAAVGALNPLDAARSISPSILDTRDVHGMTPVAWACAFGQRHIIQYARSHGTDVCGLNLYSWNFPDLAVANKHLDLADELTIMGAAAPKTSLINRMKAYGIQFHS